MAAVFIPDTVEGSEIDVQVGQKQKVRGGLVSGIDGDPQFALDQILTAIAATGLALGQSITFDGKTLYFRRVVGKTVAADQAKVQLIFDNDFGGQASAYVITTRGYLQAYQSNRVPGTRDALLVPAFGTGAATVPADLAMCTFEYPMRQVSVSGIKQGAPPAEGTYDGYIGYGNDLAWYGKPKGYWKILSGGSSLSKYSGFFSYDLSAVSKNIEDWRTLHTLYNHKANIYVQLDDDTQQHMVNIPYAHGIIDSGPGWLVVGPYPVTNYPALFGF